MIITIGRVLGALCLKLFFYLLYDLFLIVVFTKIHVMENNEK